FTRRLAPASTRGGGPRVDAGAKPAARGTSLLQIARVHFQHESTARLRAQVQTRPRSFSSSTGAPSILQSLPVDKTPAGRWREEKRPVSLQTHQTTPRPPSSAAGRATPAARCTRTPPADFPA